MTKEIVQKDQQSVDSFITKAIEMNAPKQTQNTIISIDKETN